MRERDLERAGKEGAASVSPGPKGTWQGPGGDGPLEGKGRSKRTVASSLALLECSFYHFSSLTPAQVC